MDSTGLDRCQRCWVKKPLWAFEDPGDRNRGICVNCAKHKTKVCIRCGQDKPVFDAFDPAPVRDGLHPECRKCLKAMKKKGAKAIHEGVINSLINRNLRLLETALEEEEMLARKAQQQREKAERRARKERVRNEINPHNWKATRERLTREQNGHCAICGRQFSEHIRPCLDHCHTTDVIRGVLCNKCNQGLGCFADDPCRMSRAIEYLEQFRS